MEILLVGVVILLSSLVCYFLFWPVIGKKSTLLSGSLRKFYDGKVVIVTGASRGIGETLSRQLVTLGAKVMIAARTERSIRAITKDCNGINGDRLAAYCKADVSVEGDCRKLVEETVKEFGGVDIIIMNAACLDTFRLFEEIRDKKEVFLSMFETNCMQCVYLTDAALPYLKKSTRGTLVGISSMAGLLGVYGQVAYSTSKHAMQGFFKSVRMELGNSVHTIVFPLPFVRTEDAVRNSRPSSATYGITPEDCASRILNGIPSNDVERIISFPEKIGGVVGYLFPKFYQKIMPKFLRNAFLAVPEAHE